MKRFFLFVLIIILLNSIANAYLESGSIRAIPEQEKGLATTIFSNSDNIYINNKGPVNTLIFPTDSIVVNGNYVDFGWNYEDAEGDNQVNYALEIDDDQRFLSPFTYYGFSETNRRVYILLSNRDYYWRVKSKDAFKWGEFSEAGTFYLDSSKKVCEDGTPYSQCSRNDLRFCDGGELTQDCKTCGCPINSECTLNGECVQKTCFDGTRYGFCNSRKQPNFCQNGAVKEVCSLCGCSEGKECNPDGTCSSIIVKEIVKEEISVKLSVFSKFLQFFKNIF